jgi:hypothetical protein
MQMLKAMEAQVAASPDGQVSLTDPDSRAMATSGRGSGIVGYNVQSAVDVEHHLIVAHDVVTAPTDRNQLSSISAKAKAAMGVERLDVLADRGYFAGEEILACEAIGVTPYVPKPWTSTAKAEGRFGKQDFICVAEQNAYRCPAGNLLPYHMTTVEKGLTLHRYWDLESCRACAIKPKCTTSLNRRIMRGSTRRSSRLCSAGWTWRHALLAPDRRTPLRHDQELDGQSAPVPHRNERRGASSSWNPLRATSPLALSWPSSRTSLAPSSRRWARVRITSLCSCRPPQLAFHVRVEPVGVSAPGRQAQAPEMP